jgi:hypothetical protein
MITREECRVKVLPLAIKCYVWNITKVLERCQILEWNLDLINRANYMVSVTNESYIKMLLTNYKMLTLILGAI